MMSIKNVQGFTVIPLYFSSDSTTAHHLFIKEHSVRNYDEKKPPGKTLFMINVPPYATEDSLRRVFSVVGKVKSVTLQKTPNENDEQPVCGFKVGFIVFERRDGLAKALKLERLDPLSSRQAPILTGVSKWIREYNASVYNQEQLSEDVKKFIAESDKKEEEAKLKEKNDVDEEGWTVVTKKGRNPGIARKESVENKLIQKNKIKSRKKELKNFYTFQLKEQKMKSIIALRKSFQESKEKVNLMKKMRNFKPF